MAKDFWQHDQPFFDIRVMQVNAMPEKNKSTDVIVRNYEATKNREYSEWSEFLEIGHGTFTPLTLGFYVGMS